MCMRVCAKYVYIHTYYIHTYIHADERHTLQTTVLAHMILHYAPKHGFGTHDFALCSKTCRKLLRFWRTWSCTMLQNIQEIWRDCSVQSADHSKPHGYKGQVARKRELHYESVIPLVWLCCECDTSVSLLSKLWLWICFAWIKIYYWSKWEKRIYSKYYRYQKPRSQCCVCRKII